MNISTLSKLADDIVVFLAGEPRGKGRPRFVRATGHAFTPADTRKYESHLRLAAQDAMAGRPPIEGPVDVEVFAAFPVPQSWSRSKRANALLGLTRPTVKPDWENIAKMLDAFNEVVWRDDRQVVDGCIRKVYSDTPCLRITVRTSPLFQRRAVA